MLIRNFVVCAKDLGAFHVTSPLAKCAMDKGHYVHVVAEGLAAKAFDGAGMFSSNVGEPLQFDAVKTLCDLGRPIVVVGESVPANLEVLLAQASLESNGILVECQDFWRGHKRLGNIVPTLMLTCDEYAKRLAMEDLGLPEDRVVVVGTPAASIASVSEEVLLQFGALRETHDRVFFYAGGGRYTGDELEFLVACMDKTPGNNVVVVGFHPRGVLERGDAWRAILKPLGSRAIEAKVGTSNQWASLTTTLSGFSTLLSTAVFNGQTTVSLKTPATMASLKRQDNLDEVPWVALGCTHGIARPTDLSGFEFLADEAEKVKPYNSRVAWEAVCELMK